MRLIHELGVLLHPHAVHIRRRGCGSGPFERVLLRDVAVARRLGAVFILCGRLDLHLEIELLAA